MPVSNKINRKTVIGGLVGLVGGLALVTQVGNIGQKINQLYSNRGFIPIAADLTGIPGSFIGGYICNVKVGLGSYAVMAFGDIYKRFVDESYPIENNLLGHLGISAALFTAGLVTRYLAGRKKGQPFFKDYLEHLGPRRTPPTGTP